MKKYTVKAYLCSNHSGLIDSLETNSWTKVEEFIYENCQGGLNCLVIDNETGERKWSYAEDFTIDHADLLMEQQEQM